MWGARTRHTSSQLCRISPRPSEECGHRPRKGQTGRRGAVSSRGQGGELAVGLSLRRLLAFRGLSGKQLSLQFWSSGEKSGQEIGIGTSSPESHEVRRDHPGRRVVGEEEGTGLCPGAGPFLEVETEPAKPTAKPESLASREPGGKSFQNWGVTSCVH